MSADFISKLTSATVALFFAKKERGARERASSYILRTVAGNPQVLHKGIHSPGDIKQFHITLQSTLMWAIKTWLIPYASCKLWHGTSLDKFFFHHWTQQWPDWSDRATEWGNSAGRASADIEPFCCHLHIIILCRISRHPASCVLLWSEW